MKLASEHERMKHELIDGTIKSVFQNGLEGLTSKSIAFNSGLNEAYIYRYFEDKSDLLLKSFRKTDAELFEKLKECYVDCKTVSLNTETRFKYFFENIWDFIMNNQTICVFYNRFVSSPAYTRQARAEHKANLIELVSIDEDKLINSTDFEFVMDYCVNSILYYAYLVSIGDEQNTPLYKEKICGVIYRSIDRQIQYCIQQGIVG